MRNIVYYHAYLDDYYTWAQIFVEQMKYFEMSGLFNNIETIKVTAITQPDRRQEIFRDLCEIYPAHFEIEFIQNIHASDQEMMAGWADIFSEKIPNIGETPTLSKMYKESQGGDDYNILYFHMKGITSTLNNLLVPGRVSKYKNRYDWRQFMNWGVLTNWRDCVAALEHNDVAGVDYVLTPTRFFKGNFFWTKSSYVRTLPDPVELDWWADCKAKSNDDWLQNCSDRFRDERWICYNDYVKVFNLADNKGNYIYYDI